MPGHEETLSRVIVSVTDITERKQAEEQLHASLREKELLLREIHHRVRNNLSIISGLLGLQAETLQDPQALRAFQESQDRIQSIALIHEQLHRAKELVKIDAADYLQDVADHLVGSSEGLRGTIALNVHIDGDISLDIDTAMPCGLIVNELVSNCLQHAFPLAETPGREQEDPEGRQGEIRVEMHSQDGEVALTVSDNGVGLPPDFDFQDTESLGLQLVGLLTKQLEGAIELDRSAGTTLRITFAEQ